MSGNSIGFGEEIRILVFKHCHLLALPGFHYETQVEVVLKLKNINMNISCNLLPLYQNFDSQWNIPIFTGKSKLYCSCKKNEVYTWDWNFEFENDLILFLHQVLGWDNSLNPLSQMLVL